MVQEGYKKAEEVWKRLKKSKEGYKMYDKVSRRVKKINQDSGRFIEIKEGLTGLENV